MDYYMVKLDYIFKKIKFVELLFMVFILVLLKEERV